MLLQDRFTGASLDLNKWGGLYGTILPKVEGQRLKLQNQAASTQYTGLFSTGLVTMTGDEAFIEMVDAGNQSLVSLEVYPLEFYKDASNRVMWIVANGTLVALKRVAGANTTVFSTAYNGTTHRWFKLRETAGTLYWETSTDGDTWTVRHSEATPFTLTNIQLGITLGTYASEASATSALFDNLNYNPAASTSFAVTANTSTGFEVSLTAPDIPVNTVVPSDYAVRTEVNEVTPSDYAVRTEVVFVVGSDYYIKVEALNTIPTDYAVKSEVATVLPTDYGVLTEQVDTLSSSYDVRTEVFIPLPADYAVNTEVLEVVPTDYAIKTVSSIAVDVTYRVNTEQGITLTAEYEVVSVTEVSDVVPSDYYILTEALDTIASDYAVKTEAVDIVGTDYAVCTELYVPVPSDYAVLNGVLTELPTNYSVVSSNLVAVPTDYGVLTVEGIVLPAAYVVSADVTPVLTTLQASYRIWSIERGEGEVYAPNPPVYTPTGEVYAPTGNKYPSTDSPYTPSGQVY